MASIDWNAIKNEYVSTNTSFRKLADKYSVNKDTIAKRAKAENWADLKDKQTDKIQTKTMQKTADRISAKEAAKIDRVLSTAEKLLAKLEQAADELDCQPIVNTTTVKKYVSNDGTPPVEITKTDRKLVYTRGIIKTNDLKRLTAALKDIKEIRQDITGGASTDTSKLFTALELEGEE